MDSLARRLLVGETIESSRISEGEAVFGEVGVGGLDAESAEHSDDLAAMERGMVDGMENDLPARDAEVSPIGHDGGEFGGQVGVGGGFEPLPVALPEFGPRLDEEFEGVLRSGAGRQRLSAALDDAAEPDALAVVDVAEGAENAGVGCAEAAIQLVGGERRAGLEQLAGGPSGVACVGEQELLELGHRGDYR
jgi:hypothetical protein